MEKKWKLLWLLGRLDNYKKTAFTTSRISTCLRSETQVKKELSSYCFVDEFRELNKLPIKINNHMFEEYFKNQDVELLKINKNQILQVPGSIPAKAFYVKKGLLRSYKIDDNGKTHILMFAPEGWIISDIESHILSSPSELYIDSLEDSEIIKIKKFDLIFFQQVEKNNSQLIEKLVRRIAVLQKRVVLLMSSTAKQRYEHFLSTYPQLTNRISLKMIASYLGITPEALSNIRSKMRNE